MTNLAAAHQFLLEVCEKENEVDYATHFAKGIEKDYHALVELEFIVDVLISDYQNGILYQKPAADEEILPDPDRFDITSARNLVKKLTKQQIELSETYAALQIDNSMAKDLCSQLNYLLEVIIPDYERGCFTKRVNNI